MFWHHVLVFINYINIGIQRVDVGVHSKRHWTTILAFVESTYNENIVGHIIVTHVDLWVHLWTNQILNIVHPHCRWQYFNWIKIRLQCDLLLKKGLLFHDVSRCLEKVLFIAHLRTYLQEKHFHLLQMMLCPSNLACGPKSLTSWFICILVTTSNAKESQGFLM